ncbi:hypothetical protein RND71_030550 [Anisodus tanguticus]|uniref:DUF7804 domain-containing protein n=1 Tax=Anisodus tanguticus TaxID=243964 RepID=A0AAE1RHY6_9SOLA|nr:hypothetical protein RND71_030550 [Anisodus tanguticus]
MASLKIHHLLIHHVNKHNPISDFNFNTNTSLPVTKRMLSHRISASLSLSNPPSNSGGVIKEDKKTEALSSRKLDEWMKESVVDIVKNLKQAPLLVHIYAEEDKVKIKTERAVEEDWPVVKSEWESGEKRSPDGLIFVGELGTDEEKDEKIAESEEGITKAWGVVVQGKGVECSPACYLLKTSRVGAGFGMGLFCTHFCLARVQNFRDSALVQFKNSWLLQ